MRGEKLTSDPTTTTKIQEGLDPATAEGGDPLTRVRVGLAPASLFFWPVCGSERGCGVTVVDGMDFLDLES